MAYSKTGESGEVMRRRLDSTSTIRRVPCKFLASCGIMPDDEVVFELDEQKCCLIIYKKTTDGRPVSTARLKVRESDGGVTIPKAVLQELNWETGAFFAVSVDAGSKKLYIRPDDSKVDAAHSTKRITRDNMRILHVSNGLLDLVGVRPGTQVVLRADGERIILTPYATNEQILAYLEGAKRLIYEAASEKMLSGEAAEALNTHIREMRAILQASS